jgi:FKBP12-rapamycin complex-associated protein
LFAETKSQAASPFGRLDGNFVQKAISLCGSTDINDKLAGITAIGERRLEWEARLMRFPDCMVTVLPPEEVSTAVKLSANVLKALPSPDPFVMSLAAKVYG